MDSPLVSKRRTQACGYHVVEPVPGRHRSSRLGERPSRVGGGRLRGSDLRRHGLEDFREILTRGGAADPHSHAALNSDTARNCHSSPDQHVNYDADPHRQPGSICDAHACANCYATADLDAHAFANGHAESDFVPDATSDCKPTAKSNGHSPAHGDDSSYYDAPADVDTGSDLHPGTHCNADSVFRADRDPCSVCDGD